MVKYAYKCNQSNQFHTPSVPSITQKSITIPLRIPNSLVKCRGKFQVSSQPPRWPSAQRLCSLRVLGGVEGLGMDMKHRNSKTLSFWGIFQMPQDYQETRIQLGFQTKMMRDQEISSQSRERHKNQQTLLGCFFYCFPSRSQLRLHAFRMRWNQACGKPCRSNLGLLPPRLGYSNKQTNYKSLVSLQIPFWFPSMLTCPIGRNVARDGQIY